MFDEISSGYTFHDRQQKTPIRSDSESANRRRLYLICDLKVTLIGRRSKSPEFQITDGQDRSLAQVLSFYLLDEIKSAGGFHLGDGYVNYKRLKLVSP
jgi:hypothetical protein